LLRRAWDDQQRFPLRVVTTLSQQFAAHGLQFFKVNKTITHVAVARPHYLDLVATPVSEGVKRIVDFIQMHPGCTRRNLIEALAPAPARPAAVETPGAAEGAVATDPGVAAPSSVVPPPGGLQEPTPEQTTVIADLHWLIHQGHVIEFANGKIETAKKPVPKPPRPATKPSGAEAANAENTADAQAIAVVEPGSDAGSEPVGAPPGALSPEPVREGTANASPAETPPPVGPADGNPSAAN